MFGPSSRAESDACPLLPCWLPAQHRPKHSSPSPEVPVFASHLGCPPSVRPEGWRSRHWRKISPNCRDQVSKPPSGKVTPAHKGLSVREKVQDTCHEVALLVPCHQSPSWGPDLVGTLECRPQDVPRLCETRLPLALVHIIKTKTTTKRPTLCAGPPPSASGETPGGIPRCPPHLRLHVLQRGLALWAQVSSGRASEESPSLLVRPRFLVREMQVTDFKVLTPETPDALVWEESHGARRRRCRARPCDAHTLSPAPLDSVAW